MGASAERAYWTALLRRISKGTRGRADAEDLMHSAYLRLERYRAKCEVRDQGAFMVRTAINVGTDIDRRKRYESVVELEALLDLHDPAPLQEEILTARARLARVNEGLARLPPRTREVFLLHRLDGLKYREIASRLDISQSAVEKHIARATLFLTQWTAGW